MDSNEIDFTNDVFTSFSADCDGIHFVQESAVAAVENSSIINQKELSASKENEQTCREELEQHSNEAPISRGSPKSTIDILRVQMKDGSTQSDVDECVSKMAAESVTKMAADVEHQSSECQTDIGGVNAFYSRKSLKPFVVLEEGVTAYEHYSSDHGSYILLTEDGTQTVSVGHSTFHKATQAPDMSYNPYTNKNVLKPSLDNTDSVKTSANESSSEVPKVEAVAVAPAHPG